MDFCTLPNRYSSCALRFAGRFFLALALIGSFAFAQVRPQSQPKISSAKAAPELQEAARTGDLALLRSRLQAGDSPNARDAARRTPLINAASAGQVGAMRVLL